MSTANRSLASPVNGIGERITSLEGCVALLSGQQFCT